MQYIGCVMTLYEHPIIDPPPYHDRVPSNKIYNNACTMINSLFSAPATRVQYHLHPHNGGY